MSIPTSRRAMLAGAATLSAASAINLAAIVASRAADADPIFAAIDAHRTAWSGLNTIISKESRLEDELPRIGDNRTSGETIGRSWRQTIHDGSP